MTKTLITVSSSCSKKESSRPHENKLKISPSLYQKIKKRGCIKQVQQVQQVSFHGGMMEDFEFNLKSQESLLNRNEDKILASQTS